MKKLLIALVAVLTFAAVPVSAQTYMGSTTLSSAVTATQNYVVVASATNVAVGGALYIDRELLKITAVSGTRVTVTRQQAPSTHSASAVVIVIPAAAVNTTLVTVDPRPGTCTPGDYAYLPIINTDSGNVWLCRYIAAAAPARVWAATNLVMVNGQTSLLLNLQ